MIMKIEGRQKQTYLIHNNFRKIMKIKTKLSITAFFICILWILSACSKSNNPSLNEHNPLQWRWVVKPGEYEDVAFVDDELLAVKNDEGKYGILNTKGEVLAPFIYDAIYDYRDGRALAVNGENYLYLDNTGEIAISNVFQQAHSFSEGFASVKIGDLWGYVGLSGELLVPCEYEDCQPFSEGFGAVQTGGKWGFINQKGELLIFPQFDEVFSFSEGFAAVRLNEKWCFIDGEGSVITSQQYDSVRNFREGYAAVMLDGKWGFIDKTGQQCVSCHYNDVGNFSEEKAAVKVDYGGEEGTCWAYINPADEVVIDFYPYDASEGRVVYVGEFKDGIAFVSKTLYCIIDEKGRNIFPGDSEFFISTLNYNAEYDAIPGYVFTDAEMKVRKYGLMGMHGEERLKPVFDYVEGIHGKYVIVLNLLDGRYKKGIIEIVRR